MDLLKCQEHMKTQQFLDKMLDIGLIPTIT